ncbi:MAG: class I SAM-dependent methyltransferase [Nanoarchaeota archaeon]
MQRQITLSELEQTNEKFFDFWSRFYDKKGFFSRFLFNIVYKTIKSINIKQGSKILDVGCGTGNLLYLLERQKKNFKLYGIDISEKMLEVAEKKLNNVSLIRTSVFNLDKKFKNNFDYIFVVDVFHHIPEQEKTTKKFHRLLKNNGKLIITDFDFGKTFNYIFHVIEPGNSGLNNKKQMKTLFIKSGFFVEKQKKLGLFSIMTVGIKMKNKYKNGKQNNS